LIRSRGATLVYAVDAGSPAESAGVKAGDILETINHVAAGNLSIRDIRRALKSKDGLTVSLTLQRVATVFDVSLRLKQTL
jgi:C-terminal processing protease CtpA/Prc